MTVIWDILPVVSIHEIEIVENCKLSFVTVFEIFCFLSYIMHLMW